MKMQVVFFWAGVAALLVAIPSGLLAATYYVSASGSDTPPYDTWEMASHTIQAAVDSCISGDTILVGAGTYSPTSGEAFPIRIGELYTGPSTAIFGVGGAPQTIVDAQGSGEVFHFICSDVDIRGLTIRGGSGDGIYLLYGNVSIADSKIENNGLQGVKAELSGTIHARRSSITGNGYLGMLAETIVYVDSCIISGNGGRIGYGEGGICARGARVTNSEISGNFGCGVHTGGASVVLVRTRISRNRGAGVCYELEGPLVRRGLPRGLEKSALRPEQGYNMDACVVADNGMDGIAIGEGSGTFYARASTISRNGGSGIDCFISYINLTNCIVSHNQGPSASYYGPPYAANVLTCCDIFGNTGGDWVTGIADQEGVNRNFSLDPFFCGLAANNFYLGVSSPCADHLGCGQVGALGVGCGPTSVEYTTWGKIKSMFR